MLTSCLAQHPVAEAFGVDGDNDVGAKCEQGCGCLSDPALPPKSEPLE
jgi:hypothetical protein